MKISDFKNHRGVAIIESNSEYTYQDLAQRIDELSIELTKLIENDDVICINSDYSFNSIALLFAATIRNCIIVPIVPTAQSEFENKITAAAVNKIICFEENKLIIKKVSNDGQVFPTQYKEILNGGHSGLVLFSSGTTGSPKVMVHNLSEIINDYKTPKKARNLNFLLFLLFDHIGGINTLLNCLNNGTTITIPLNRNPEYILQIIEDKKVQILPTTPTFLNLILMNENFEKYDLSSLKMITYGTERMPQALLDKLKIKIPHVKFLQTFGTSETGIMKTESKSSTRLFFKIVDPNYQYKIENDQLYLKSKNQIKEYINHESNQFEEDSWFATGDIVETDEDGFIRIIGRINNIINVGGLKVFPKEIEDVINEVTGVVDTTVYSRNSIITGQMVCADIVIKPDVDKKIIKEQILKNCREKLEKYKIPSKISLSDSLSFSSRFKKTTMN